MPIPIGHRVRLPDRGTTFVREVPGPPGAPTVVLLHGWLASGGLNWFQVFDKLPGYRILAPDLRGHGRGIKTRRRRFTIADCAEDVDALLEVLGIDEAIVVGYSMGGPVAQTLWRHNPDRISGMVLAATGAEFVRAHERAAMLAAMGIAVTAVRAGDLNRYVPSTLARQILPTAKTARAESLQRWARSEMRRHSARMVTEAGVAIANFDAKPWISSIDVPTSVIVTTDDMAVLPEAQRHMAEVIPGARLLEHAGGHIACMAPEFGETVVAAIDDVSARGGAGVLSAP